MRPTFGIFLALSSVLAFTIMGAVVKALDEVPVGEIVFFRAGSGMLVLLVWLWHLGELPGGLRVRSVGGHAVRAIVGSVSMACNFAALHFLLFPEATALRFITPILIVLFAALLLGERVRLLRIGAVVVGLLGVMIIMWPNLTLEGGRKELIGTLLMLASAILAALAQITIKAMAARESTAAIVFYFSGTAALLSLVTLPWGWVWPGFWEWVLLLGAGLSGGIGQILVTASYRHADASLLAPFTYSAMIWSLLIGYFVFAELPTGQMLLGAALVIGAGVFIVWRERQLGKDQAARGKIESLR